MRRRRQVIGAVVLQVGLGLLVRADAGAPCAGDLDASGLIDSTDLNLILASFGCTTGCQGDADADGDVDSTDLNFLLASFGQACVPACGPGAPGCCAPSATPGCIDPECCESVCATDPSCCDAAWDATCAAAALADCAACEGPGACCLSRGGCLIMTADACLQVSGIFQGGGAQCVDLACPDTPTCGMVGAGPCCAEGSTPYCQDAECCELVCSADPFCCAEAWDASCAQRALDDCGFCHQTTRWHVDYQNGDDANNGLSWEAAFATNARLIEVLGDNDVAYFRGQYHADDDDWFEGYKGVALIGDPGYDFDGEGNGWIGRQTIPLDPDGWSEVFAGVYVHVLEPDLPIQGVVQDWDATTLADQGFPQTHAGHLPQASDPTLIDGHWRYDPANGFLYLRPWGGGDPADHDIEYILDNHAIALVNCDNCTLRNFTAKLATRFSSGEGGYGVRGQSTVNCTFEDCRVYDAGDHAVGIAGPKSVNNLVQRIEVYGQNHAPDGDRPSILFVFAGFNANGGGDRATDCYASPTPLLRPDATPLYSLDQWNGSFGLSHGGPTTTQTDIEWRRCVYDCRALQAVKTGGWDINKHRQGFIGGATSAPGFDPLQPHTYPNRTFDCSLIDAYQFSGGGAIAHHRLAASVDASGFTTSSGGLAFLNSTSIQWFDYCAIVGSVQTNNTTYGNAFFRAKNNVTVEVRARNSLFAIVTDSAFPNSLNQTDGAFVAGGKPATVVADRCVFLRTGAANGPGPNFMSLSNSPAVGTHVAFTDCWYAALDNAGGPAYFSIDKFGKGLTTNGATLIEAMADWVSLVDPAGVYLVDPELVGGWPILDPLLTEPGETSPLRQAAFKRDPRASVFGINGLLDDGTIGPWQYGGAPR